MNDNNNFTICVGMPTFRRLQLLTYLKDACIFFQGDYHDQPFLHFGIVECVTDMRSHFNFNLFLKWVG